MKTFEVRTYLVVTSLVSLILSSGSFSATDIIFSKQVGFEFRERTEHVRGATKDPSRNILRFLLRNEIDRLSEELGDGDLSF